MGNEQTSTFSTNSLKPLCMLLAMKYMNKRRGEGRKSTSLFFVLKHVTEITSKEASALGRWGAVQVENWGAAGKIAANKPVRFCQS